MTKKIGRPLKYSIILNQLDPNRLYTAASVATFARNHLLLQGETEARVQRSYQRVRIALGSFSRKRNFPPEGDGLVTTPGRQSFPGWYGWRWQQAILEKE